MSKVNIAPDEEHDSPTRVAKQSRAILEELLRLARLYETSEQFAELMAFVVRLRNVAPFNAMLLQIQKPGLRYAATKQDWQERFGRLPKDKARPLLILWPFSPVVLVYDVIDTEGRELPDDAFSYYAKGTIDNARMSEFRARLAKKEIHFIDYDQGDTDAGYISRKTHSKDKTKYSRYELGINRNHDAPTAFVTLAHELGHLFLGHLGADKKLGIGDRRRKSHRVQEIEAECVAYLVSLRNGVKCNSYRYLHDYVRARDSTETLDVHAIMLAAGSVESHLDLSEAPEVLPEKEGSKRKKKRKKTEKDK
jgi:hypothetical protein